jgi:hypothetical protein
MSIFFHSKVSMDPVPAELISWIPNGTGIWVLPRLPRHAPGHLRVGTKRGRPFPARRLLDSPILKSADHPPYN